MSSRSLWRAGSVALVIAVAAAQESNAQAITPSFACTPQLESSVVKAICADGTLAALDRQLADVYAAASAKVTDAERETLATAQRGWSKRRDDCWKSNDLPACVNKQYRDRIAGLQAQFRLVNPVGSARYVCPGGAAGREAVADYFATDPPTALVEFDGTREVMWNVGSGSGARYAGVSHQLWEHQGVALIRWGGRVKELRCLLQR